jgi:LmbE family N-acetylglucosaminyl deacetylase
MKILVVASHPDDEVLGCGGTVAKLSKHDAVYTLLLGRGIASRDILESEKIKRLKKIKNESKRANKILGAKKIFFEDFPDNRFDTVPLLSIIKSIEKVMQETKPDVIFTHHHGDLNIDHQITNKAVLTAARPVGDYSVKKILAFEVLSSTEWHAKNRREIFSPNTYVDISKTIGKKLSAMRCYKSEIRPYPHPRSLEGIKILAKKRGLEVGLRYAEAFYLARLIE